MIMLSSMTKFNKMTELHMYEYMRLAKNVSNPNTQYHTLLLPTEDEAHTHSIYMYRRLAHDTGRAMFGAFL